MIRTTILLLLITLISCTSKKFPPEPSANGIWQQLGYGKIIQIRNDSLKIYDYCKAGCNLYEETMLEEIGKVDSFTADTLIIRKNIKTYKYYRINRLPQLCLLNKEKSKNPAHNFEVLWHTFNEQYCYFDEREIDWDLIYQQYKPKITKETTELELYQIFDDILSSMNDGHVAIDLPEHLAEAYSKIKKEKPITSEEASNTERPEISTFDLGIKTQDDMAEFYCENLKRHNGGIANWGMMKDKIAYIQINAMLALAFYDLPTDLSFREFYPQYAEIAEKRPFQRQDEIDGAGKLMRMIIEEFKDAKAIVLDLRFNIGGKDEAGLAMIGHFVKDRKTIASKKARLNTGFTNHQNIYLESREPTFLKNVYILTSHRTTSAAELAVTASLRSKNIKRIGSNTEGIFSDGLDRKLPIGWEYVLSNEVYEDVNGNNYEAKGVPPDIKINYPKDKRAFYNLLLNQLSAKGDEAIERVFQLEKI